MRASAGTRDRRIGPLTHPWTAMPRRDKCLPSPATQLSGPAPSIDAPSRAPPVRRKSSRPTDTVLRPEQLQAVPDISRPCPLRVPGTAPCRRVQAPAFRRRADPAPCGGPIRGNGEPCLPDRVQRRMALCRLPAGAESTNNTAPKNLLFEPGSRTVQVLEPAPERSKAVPCRRLFALSPSTAPPTANVHRARRSCPALRLAFARKPAPRFSPSATRRRRARRHSSPEPPLSPAPRAHAGPPFHWG